MLTPPPATPLHLPLTHHSARRRRGQIRQPQPARPCALLTQPTPGRKPAPTGSGPPARPACGSPPAASSAPARHPPARLPHRRLILPPPLLQLRHRHPVNTVPLEANLHPSCKPTLAGTVIRTGGFSRYSAALIGTATEPKRSSRRLMGAAAARISSVPPSRTKRAPTETSAGETPSPDTFAG